MKKTLIILHIFLFTISYAQFGINTLNPQGIFHVDGEKDNFPSGPPTTLQQANDFIVDSSGNVGIGKTSPQKKMDVDAANQPLNIRNLLRQVPLNHNILVRDGTTGDVVSAKYSYSANSANIPAGSSGSITIPSTINIPAGMLIIRANNACGRTMISLYIYSDISLGYLSSVARDKVGTTSFTPGNNTTSGNWQVKFANVAACADNGNGTQFNYTVAKTGNNTYTITNNGNIGRVYNLTIFRL